MKYLVEWLTEVLVFERVYWYLAIPFTVLLIIQLIATFAGLGGDSDGDVDLDDGGDFEPGFRIFTVRNFITFFAVFGWSGITFSHSGLGQTATILVSSVIGVLVLLVVSALFYSITRLASSGTMNIQNAVGVTGEVYLPIPASRNGMGKISITFQGSFREMDAMTDGDKKIPRGAVVKVKGIVSSSILLVEKIQKGDV